MYVIIAIFQRQLYTIIENIPYSRKKSLYYKLAQTATTCDLASNRVTWYTEWYRYVELNWKVTLHFELFAKKYIKNRQVSKNTLKLAKYIEWADENLYIGLM